MIANFEFQFQIVDTYKSLETRDSIGFPPLMRQFNRTLLIECKVQVEECGNQVKERMQQEMSFVRSDRDYYN